MGFNSAFKGLSLETRKWLGRDLKGDSFHLRGWRLEETRYGDHVAFNAHDVGHKQVARDSATVCAAVCRTSAKLLE